MNIKYPAVLFLLFLLLHGTNAYPAGNDKQALKKADQLLAERKYESAFELLEQADSGNKSPLVFLKKVDIALNYFITSVNHTLFSFQDLKEGEDLLALRGSPGKRKVYKLAIHEALSQLVDKYPKNRKYKRILGYFLFDYYNRFERQAGEKADTSYLAQSKELLLEAYKHREYDNNSLNALGYFDYAAEKYDSAIVYFKKSYRLNTSDIYAVYLLTAAYFKAKKDEQAIKYGTIGLNLQNSRYDLKADLARILGIIYKERKDTKNAATYLDLAEEYSRR